MRMFMGKRDIVLYFDRKKRWCLDISYVYIYIYTWWYKIYNTSMTNNMKTRDILGLEINFWWTILLGLASISSECSDSRNLRVTLGDFWLGTLVPYSQVTTNYKTSTTLSLSLYIYYIISIYKYTVIYVQMRHGTWDWWTSSFIEAEARGIEVFFGAKKPMAHHHGIGRSIFSYEHLNFKYK